MAEDLYCGVFETNDEHGVRFTDKYYLNSKKERLREPRFKREDLLLEAACDIIGHTVTLDELREPAQGNGDIVFLEIERTTA